MAKNIAIIFAGGSGVRMGAGKPKQFLEVGGMPIIIHTLEIFENHPDIDEIYVACKEDYIEKLKKLLRRYDIEKVMDIVPGGTTGMGSIYNALRAARAWNDEDSIVLIHDGVRPCINSKLIDEVIESVKKNGAAATCTPLFETPVVSKGGELVETTPSRAECYTAQAPQGFRLGEVISAHDEVRAKDAEYTGIVDNCTLMRQLGREVAIVKGPRSNIKVTTPEDLYIFKAMIEYRETRDALGLES
ncbi:MAG: 2-C-methyl-D-erythritol 4-phosphate cytidylyltransferase [Mogibacterium sp.]|nr:2-C-methyl-D-erythritol 4-phosphate cytidylyltransferase [Mogibacterium sp.]